jgi:hypothetical protein
LKPLNSQVQQYGGMNNGGKLADTFVEGRQGLFRQPTAGEVSRLTYGELRDLRACRQEEARNHFAHLLNRGSSLE